MKTNEVLHSGLRLMKTNEVLHSGLRLMKTNAVLHCGLRLMKTNGLLHQLYWINNKEHCEAMKCVSGHSLHEYLKNVDYFHYWSTLSISESTKSHRCCNG